MALFTFVSAGKTKAADLKSAQGVVEDIPTIQAFLDEPVPDSDLQKIVNAGINSQSAMNGQSWHFSVVTNKAVEANFLGYGAKIISSPTIALNGDNKEHFKKILGIPEDMSAKAVLIIGKRILLLL